MSIYGEIITAKHVRTRMLQFLERWTPFYIAEIGAQDQRDRDALPPFQSFSFSNDNDKFASTHIPACIVMVPGLTQEDPQRDGRGKYRATFDVRVAALCSGRDEVATQELAELYTAAIRAAVVQHSSLDGFAQASTWVDEVYGLDAEDRRTLAMGVVEFEVEVANVIDASAGPKKLPEHPHTPISEYGKVKTVNTEIGGMNGG